jgi:hypothetical protein
MWGKHIHHVLWRPGSEHLTKEQAQEALVEDMQLDGKAYQSLGLLGEGELPHASERELPPYGYSRQEGPRIPLEPSSGDASRLCSMWQRLSKQQYVC